MLLEVHTAKRERSFWANTPTHKSLFHQRFMSAFTLVTFCRKKYFRTKNLPVMMKLTPGLNFTNIFAYSFYASSSQKLYVNMLVKLTAGRNDIRTGFRVFIHRSTSTWENGNKTRDLIKTLIIIYLFKVITLLYIVESRIILRSNL